MPRVTSGGNDFGLLRFRVRIVRGNLVTSYRFGASEQPLLDLHIALSNLALSAADRFEAR